MLPLLIMLGIYFVDSLRIWLLIETLVLVDGA